MDEDALECGCGFRVREGEEVGRVWRTRLEKVYMAVNRAFEKAVVKAEKIRSLRRSYVLLETSYQS